MEGSIAEELYSGVLKTPKTELDPQSSSKDAIDSSLEDVGDDLWDDEDDMGREWQRRQQEFHRLGFREGLMAGKEVAAQKGFNLGFKESVFVGQKWGIARGVTSALAFLRGDLKEKLIETEEKRRRFQSLHESVRVISTNDALKLFYDSLNGSKSSDQGETRQDSGSRIPDNDVLEAHVQECKMLVHECSALKVHLPDDHELLEYSQVN